MKAYLDCYPCLLSQALNTSRMFTSDEPKIHDILKSVCLLLPTLPFDATPPEMGKELYRLIAEKTGIEDPFKAVKDLCTQQALGLYPELKRQIRASNDPLKTAVRVSIAGNVIDFGTTRRFDIEKDLETVLIQEFAIDHYPQFLRALDNVEEVLFIGDNAGETVFDRLLIEELGKPVTYIVRERPILNDATVQDAVAAGIDKVARIFSSGSDAPGNILSLCSEEFLEIYRSAGMIISKGQGNYEGLSEEKRPIFFLLKAKCQVIASDIGIPQGSIILMQAKDTGT
jgi:uncharacterized protein with ATP-grasp and redox domains